ncbi:hypothetical protein TGPRC2_225210 [Toxoplasma gondii TgCatPRC2]|uniref:Uncharacterized protein n=9 Tax=Toxoplasma gondii TaxID=5811 RepID=S7UWC5_TOXGG|nr:hypothetical protein TGGT1_225210 [Toxoplasma gondii GT1]KAF4640566.1 hypothetical protein TGRH88_044920 [Toxoplasma gondii]KFG55086.1 hypothetical protein TGFOU_225210 [Toxoplasma gondii FOU]KFG60782.1 hypothetical protein TGRUB_225210 [Toxoplasma gondii RUB]KFH13328.1 hypothetical protein TGVAND_225210 [Toxoplasma gondii VAND]KYF43171.1 hypothetical protein TGARI_225210 [Toxoplasma gondii ARI]KYK71875.1 hypothetical protein TGPRC2_225210 [Toxoplasma gondii TgCatPRC2]PUA91253.1 hypotheti
MAASATDESPCDFKRCPGTRIFFGFVNAAAISESREESKTDVPWFSVAGQTVSTCATSSDCQSRHTKDESSHRVPSAVPCPPPVADRAGACSRTEASRRRSRLPLASS